MTLREVLLAAGWTYEPAEHVCQWRDPLHHVSLYSLDSALSVQDKREQLAAMERERAKERPLTIAAIKAFRDKTGCSLKEASDYVRAHPAIPPKGAP